MLMQVWEVSSCGAYDCARLAIVGRRGMRAVGAGVLLAAAMARDLYVGKRPTLLLLTLMTVMVIAPQYGSGVIGLAQHEGGQIEEIRPGDIVWFAPGEKHWHGAKPTTAMTHVAIAESLDGKAVDWLEKVTDDQYHAHRDQH